jgi:hypothetical protein
LISTWIPHQKPDGRPCCGLFEVQPLPRKRRHVKHRRTPREALRQITSGERAYWRTYGPSIDPDGDWPDWASWLAFYAAVRDEGFYPIDRPWLRERSAAERIYLASLVGADLDAVRVRIIADLEANDPRRSLMRGARCAS